MSSDETKSALQAAEAIIGGWEDVVLCVVCGAKVPRTFRVHDASEDAADQRLEIEFNADLTGWCLFAGDSSYVGVRGLHCPKCRKSRER